jgi:hypothetical protein
VHYPAHNLAERVPNSVTLCVTDAITYRVAQRGPDYLADVDANSLTNFRSHRVSIVCTYTQPDGITDCVPHSNTVRVSHRITNPVVPIDRT